MLDLAYFQAHFRSDETAQAAYESYLCCGEGRAVKEQRALRLQLGDVESPLARTLSLRERRWVRAARLRENFRLSFSGIGRVLHLPHGSWKRIPAMVRNGQRLRALHPEL